MRWYHRTVSAIDRRCLPLLLLLAACRPAAPLNVLPETMGPWKRTSLRETPASDSPDPVPRTSVERFETATYEGPGKLQARVYELSSSGVALDLAQRWRPSSDTVFFYRGRYFVVVKWEQAERRALEDFIRELEKVLPA
jgi:hypothetical protein